MDDNKTITNLLERVGASYTVQTRQCLVCERMENPEGTIVHTGLAWLFPECKSRIKKLIYGEEGAE